MTKYTPEQFERLPKWAKALVREAEISLSTAEKMRQEAESMIQDADRLSMDRSMDPGVVEKIRGPIRVFRDYTDVPVGRERDQFSFHLESEHRRSKSIMVGLTKDGTLQVHGTARLTLHLRASNTVDITVED